MKYLPLFMAAITLVAMPRSSLAQNSNWDSGSASDMLEQHNPWTPINEGLTNLDIWSLAVSHEGALFAGTNTGLFRAQSGGEVQWELFLDTLDISSIAIDLQDGVFVGTHGDGIFRSFDGGDTWEAANDGLTNLDVSAIAVDLDDVWYAATHLGSVFRSVDLGDTWTEVLNTALDAPFIPSLAIDINNQDVFAGSDGGVFRSEDGGDTWESVNDGLDNPFVESLAISPDGVLFAGTDGGVFRSLDDANTWEAVHDETLGEVTIRSVVLNDLDALFAGTHGGGVFRSLTHGATWEPVNEGLENLDVSAMAIDGNGALLAATHGGGVFMRDATTDVSTEEEQPIPVEYVLQVNYPNPFNTATVIRYALPAPTHVGLTVYDVTGREVATLVNNQKPEGWHEIAFIATGLPAGVYFYRLQAGDFTQVRQMIVVR